MNWNSLTLSFVSSLMRERETKERERESQIPFVCPINPSLWFTASAVYRSRIRGKNVSLVRISPAEKYNSSLVCRVPKGQIFVGLSGLTAKAERVRFQTGKKLKSRIFILHFYIYVDITEPF